VLFAEIAVLFASGAVIFSSSDLSLLPFFFDVAFLALPAAERTFLTLDLLPFCARASSFSSPFSN
jgi:hypothetical protein